MAAPTLKSQSKGNNHVLFLVRNPNGVSSQISYLSGRSIKSWTAPSLTDAMSKIVNHQIQLVFVSLSLKNVSITAIVEAIKGQGIPVIIFAEETSRKIEGDLAKMVTPNKIVPPNHNTKFLQIVQLTLGVHGQNKGGSGAGLVEQLLPANAEPYDGTSVPSEGRWIKINLEDNSVAPFTYKLMQPRSQTVGRTRYFFMGPKPPEANKEGKGWIGLDGTFYVSGRIVEMAAEETRTGRRKQYEFSSEDAAPVEKKDWSIQPQSPRPSNVAVLGAVNQIAESMVMPPATPQPAPLETGGIKAKLAQLSAKIPTLTTFMESVPGLSSFLDRLTGRREPVTNRKPANLIETKLLKATLSAVNRPLIDATLDDAAMIEKIGLAFVKTNSLRGFIISDLNDYSDQNFATFEKVVETLKVRLEKNGEEFEILLPPSVVSVEPTPLISVSKANSHFLIHAENANQRLVCIFVEAGHVTSLQPGRGHDKLVILPESLNPELKLMFNLYIDMPLNDKHLQYLRIGHLPTESSIEKFSSSRKRELLIDPASAASYYAYTAISVLHKRKD